MTIRFKCPHCKKTLGVKDHLAGRKAGCPACKKPLVIPTPKPKPVPADVEDLAAQMLGDGPAKPPEPEPAAKSIKFHCEFCDAPIEAPFAEAGQKMPCPDPECRRIVRIPVPQEDKPKDWRDIIKKGPSAALVNLPEQLDNAWGTEQKSRVSTGALEDAGAGPDIVVEPVGIGVWLQRAFWSAAIVGLIFLSVVGIRRNRAERQEKQAIADAKSLIETVGTVPPKIKLDTLAMAEIYRVAGELYCAKRKAEQARREFQIALLMAQRSDLSKAWLDADLFLIELALAQIELGGTEEETIVRERLSWPEAQKEVGKSLEKIVAEPARAMALRVVCTRLWEKKQPALAISLAGQASSKTDTPGQPSLLVAQQVALLLAQKTDKDEAQAKKLLPRPKTGKVVIEPLARIAYVEGLTRQGNFKEALDLATAKSEPPQQFDPHHRMEACIGAAAVVLADRTLEKPAEKALPFVQGALLARKEAFKENKNYQVPPWLLFQLVQAGVCVGSPREEEECKKLAEALDPAFRQHIELVCLRQQIARSETALDSDAVRLDDKLLPCSLGWLQVARLNARLGKSRDDVLGLSSEERLKPFLLAGFALGEYDRRK